MFDLPHWMEGLAAVAAAQGDVSRAATLWGAADGLFERLGLAALEEDRQVRERFRDDVDASTAWAQGHAMTLEQAIAYALTEEAVTR